MREYLLMRHKDKSVTYVVLNERLELLLSRLFLTMLDSALWVVNQVHDVIPDVDWRMDVRRLLMKSVVVTVDQVWLVQ